MLKNQLQSMTSKHSHHLITLLMLIGVLVTLLSLSFWCLVVVVWLFLVVPWGCLQFVIVVFPDHTLFIF